MALKKILVTYDIVNDSNRIAVSNLLSKYGSRIQRSVFVCEVDSEKTGEFYKKIEKRMNVERDVIHFFIICEGCWSSARVYGQAMLDSTDWYWVL